MTPARGKFLVRPVETLESLPGGQIVLTEATRKDLTAQQAEVVAVGEPAYCEDEACERPHHWQSIPLDDAMSICEFTALYHLSTLAPHTWVLLAPRCLVETDEPNLYVCAQDDVLAVLEA